MQVNTVEQRTHPQKNHKIFAHSHAIPKNYTTFAPPKKLRARVADGKNDNYFF
jgi:hypothetical protein